MKIIAIIFLLLGSVAEACVWFQAQPAFWPSQRIPVCFVSQPQNEREQQLMELVRNAFSEINRRTPFILHNFDVCSDTSGSRPQISIAFSDMATVGEASQNFQGGMNEVPNIILPTTTDLGAGSFSAQAVHEMLHMLGMQHDRPRDSKDFTNPESAYLIHEHFLFGDFDPLSIMAQAATENHRIQEIPSELLSAGDVQCLDLIANRSIASHPNTISTHALENGNLIIDPAPDQSEVFVTDDPRDLSGNQH